MCGVVYNLSLRDRRTWPVHLHSTAYPSKKADSTLNCNHFIVVRVAARIDFVVAIRIVFCTSGLCSVVNCGDALLPQHCILAGQLPLPVEKMLVIEPVSYTHLRAHETRH